MMLQILKNEKFLKYFRIFVAVALVLYFVGAILIWSFYLAIMADPHFKTSQTQALLDGVGGLFTDLPAIAFVAYIFAIFSYSKRQFVGRATWISLIMLFIFFIMSMIFFLIPFRNQLYTGSMYIFFASTFWGLVGLCLPKRCFLNHQPTRITHVLRIIFYLILVLTYFVTAF